MIKNIEKDWTYHDYIKLNRVYKSERTLELHTGGWSGNESILYALKRNRIFKAIFFYKHITGGHYWFRIHNNFLKNY